MTKKKIEERAAVVDGQEFVLEYLDDTNEWLIFRHPAPPLNDPRSAELARLADDVRGGKYDVVTQDMHGDWKANRDLAFRVAVEAGIPMLNPTGKR